MRSPNLDTRCFVLPYLREMERDIEDWDPRAESHLYSAVSSSMTMRTAGMGTFEEMAVLARDVKWIDCNGVEAEAPGVIFPPDVREPMSCDKERLESLNLFIKKDSGAVTTMLNQLSQPWSQNPTMRVTK